MNLFNTDAFKSQNPLLKHKIRDGWSMPAKPPAYCGCCQVVYPAMWLDDDSPEGMVHTCWISSCNHPCGEIESPLTGELGSHTEQMIDLQILGFELSHDRGLAVNYLDYWGDGWGNEI